MVLVSLEESMMRNTFFLEGYAKKRRKTVKKCGSLPRLCGFRRVSSSMVYFRGKILPLTHVI